MITVCTDAAVSVTDLSGCTLASAKVRACQALDASSPAGYNIVKPLAADGQNVAKKVIVK